MKHNKIALAVMCLLAVAVCANAQSVSKKAVKKDNAQLEQVLKSRALAAQKSQRAKCHKCGEEIYDKYHQECAKGGICEQFPQNAPQNDRSNEPVYIGGDPHNPDNWVTPVKKEAKQAKAPVCAKCGEEIHSAGQHCKASGYAGLCSTEKEQPSSAPAVSRNPYFKGGDPHNEANYEKCRWCGEPLTDDKLNRRCPEDVDVYCMPAPKPQQPKAAVCAECGEEIHSAGQHCKASGYTTLCSSVKAAPAKTKQAAEASRVCPDCGATLTDDEIWHNTHICKK